MRLQWHKDGRDWKLYRILAGGEKRRVGFVEKRTRKHFKARFNFPRGGYVQVDGLLTANDGRLWVRRMVRERHPTAEFSTKRVARAA